MVQGPQHQISQHKVKLGAAGMFIYWGDSTLGAIYVQYRALRDGFCGVIANATKFYVCERYQTQQGLEGRPILLCLILQIKPPGFSLLMCVHHKSNSKHRSFLRLKYVQYSIRRQEIIYRYVKN